MYILYVYIYIYPPLSLNDRLHYWVGSSAWTAPSVAPSGSARSTYLSIYVYICAYD